MAIPPQTVIWKYLDLTKLVSLLSTRSIYFACPTEFTDPFEGFLPRSHIEAESTMLQNIIDQYSPLRDQFAARGMPEGKFDEILMTMTEQFRRAYKDVNKQFGVSCWHESEYDSDAMWKLYCPSGDGIAIESTVGQLTASLGARNDLTVGRVRYLDFDNDPIEKGHENYRLFLKRKCFEHEKEIRATILRRKEGTGERVPCDLATLITRIIVSPTAQPYVKEAIEAVCSGNLPTLNKPFRQSSIYRFADYGIDIRTKKRPTENQP